MSLRKPGIGGQLASAPCRLIPRNVSEAEAGDSEVEEFQPLTKLEAEALRAKQPTYSPWRVLAAQSSTGALLAALLGAIGGLSWWWSAMYGLAVVVVPSALMMRGMRDSLGLMPGAVLVRFAVWEAAKLLLSVAMLAAAPKLISGLNWMILLLSLVVCLKVSWAVLLFDQRRSVLPAIDSLK
jgi:ATP synthase protein I